MADERSALPLAVAALALSRLLWDELYVGDHSALAEAERPRVKGDRVRAPTRLVDGIFERLSEQPGVADSARHQLDAWLSSPARGLLRKKADGVTEFNLQLLRPSTLLATLFADERSGSAQVRADAEYLLWRGVRVRYRCGYSAETVRAIQALAEEMGRHRGNDSLHFVSDLQAPLESSLRADTAFAESAGRWVSLFLECCRLVSYIEPRYQLGKVVPQAASFDADFLLAKLFGFPTSIQGFDGLFGGGGLVLAERIRNRYTTRGRIILVRGQFGAGKSSLALSLAAEVARKPGGLSWVVPLEQTVDECRQCLQATAAPGLGGAPVIFDEVDAVLKDVKPDLNATGTPDELDVTEETDDRALVMLSSPKNDIRRLLERVAAHARETRRYPLRLWVVDPINSVVGLETGGAELRDNLVRTLREIKRQGANLILVAEADNTEQLGVDMLANVADVVTDLTTERRHGYSQRFLEVKKSRLQREQRGQHPFSIKQGTGIAVLLSSPAVKAKIRSRRIKLRTQVPQFGWDELDEQLGRDGLWADDMVVVRGDEGSPRSQIGHLFLFGSNHVSRATDDRSCSLLVSIASDSRAMERRLRLHIDAAHQRLTKRIDGSKPMKQIEYLGLAAGFIQPGTVFQRLEERIEQLQRRGKLVDRLVFDQVQQLEFGCPFIRDDETFGNTLVDFLRHRNISALFVCGAQGSYEGGFLQKTLEDEAGVLLNLERAEYRNSQRVMLQIVKTHSMQHSREKFDVEFSDDALTLKPSLIRGDRVAETRLYLHAENPLHARYHKQLESALQGIVAREVCVKSEDRTRLAGMAELGGLSAIDELQVWQVDEFQLPRLLGNSGDRRLLRSFPPSRWTWAPADKARVEVHVPKRARHGTEDRDFAAVPFYNNVSMLAMHRDSGLPEADSLTWDEIASRSWHHHHQRPGGGQSTDGVEHPYFDCPLETDEDYNCFFLELLLGTGLPRSKLTSGTEWLTTPNTVHALGLFQLLCHHAQASRAKRAAEGKGREMLRPLVARHWYTTFCHFSHCLLPHERKLFHLAPLPTPAVEPRVAIAGEWYLAIPIFSVAPLLGLEIIRALTTREEELERMRQGVGLPVSPDFYVPGAGVLSEVMPWMNTYELQLLDALMRAAFRRSEVPGYATLSPILASHLRLVASMDPVNAPPERWSEATLEPLRGVLASLHNSVKFSHSARAR